MSEASKERANSPLLRCRTDSSEVCKERAVRGLFEKCCFALRNFFNSPLTALFLHSSLTAARRLRRGLTVLSLHHLFCKFKDSSELQNYVFEGSFCSTEFFFRNSRTAANYKITFLRVPYDERHFFPNFQGQQRITKLRHLPLIRGAKMNQSAKMNCCDRVFFLTEMVKLT